MAKKENEMPSVVINGTKITMHERTSAKDFPLEENAEGFVKALKRVLDKESHELLEDSLRGLSFYMQYTMCMRIMDYFLLGELVPTGVKHVDAMIKELVGRFPYDPKMFEMFIGQPN